MTLPQVTAQLAADLRRRVQGEVRLDRYSRALYSTVDCVYQMVPVGVVIPRSAEDVAAVLQLAFREGVPVLPRGGGTSLAGQTVNHALVLDFSKYMNQVLELNPEEHWVKAQPGITLDELNHRLRPHGLHFAPDPTTSNRATVGGAIGNNTCGAHSILYGKTSDHVLELETLLSDGTPATFRALSPAELDQKLRLEGLEGAIYQGVRRVVETHRDEILQRYPRIMRRVSGYSLDTLTQGKPFDLAQLIVGSEGTLAAVTAAKLRVVPLPRHRGLAVLHFRDLIEAMEATVAVLDHQPAAVELVDRMVIDAARKSPGFAPLADWVQGDPAAVLAVEFFGESPQELEARLDALRRDMERRRLGYATLQLLDPRAQERVWAVRGAGLGLLMGRKGDMKPLPFVEDTAVAPEALPEYVRRFEQAVREEGTTAAYYGHASVGCLHIRPLINLKEQEGLDRMVAIASRVSDLVLEFGGALSGEHGDGIVRGVWTEKMFGSRLYQAFREVKRIFDPRGIMNPGKIVDCPPMTENLRYGPGYRPLAIKTVLDFSQDYGLSGAVEMCNGVGACRKTLGGAMCPSYMVTREEEHSTRGRANALRAILSGQLPPQEFTSQRLHQVMDLCVGCKACKGECPSGVDMAKLKAEFLHHYHQAHGVPLRTRLFAHVASMNRLMARLPLSDGILRLPPVRWALDRFLGIDRRRQLPPVAHPTFEEWFRHSRMPQEGSPEGRSPFGGGLGVSPRNIFTPFLARKGAAGWSSGASQHPEREESREALKGQVVFFLDTFTNYHAPQVGQAVVKVLETLGYGVVLPQRPCCGRTLISNGLLEEAKEYARRNVEALYPYVQQGMKIVGCEPSCLLTLRDEYRDLLPGDVRAKAVADNALLLEEFLVQLREQEQLGSPFAERRQKVLFHGHCHQKALVGSGPSLEALRMIPGLTVEEIDSGCCGMAGAFGYEKEHFDISMKMGERRLFPAVRATPDAEVVSNGFSCRQQIEDGTGRQPRHLAEVLAEALSNSSSTGE